MNNREFGFFGEKAAADYLSAKGYKIKQRNYYTKTGEIDVIAYNEKNIVFCEVKTRYNGQSLRYGRPASAVGYRKQNSVASAAKEYLFYNKTSLVPRFDVVEIYVSTVLDESGQNWYFIDNIVHFKGAFISNSFVKFKAYDKRLL